MRFKFFKNYHKLLKLKFEIYHSLIVVRDTLTENNNIEIVWLT
jgi:hypothetical protein